MRSVGITGGVGMGKSTSQSFLEAAQIPVVDTDQLARSLVEPGQPALADIRTQFGDEVLNPDGTLKRDALASIVFSDQSARARLESILHPRIHDLWQAQLERWRREEVALGAVVIPLLFETEAASSFDATVCVACSPTVQLERLRARGWSDAEIQQRIAAQWPVEKKMAGSDFVVWTDGDLESHLMQWDRILETLRK